MAKGSTTRVLGEVRTRLEAAAQRQLERHGDADYPAYERGLAHLLERASTVAGAIPRNLDYERFWADREQEAIERAVKALHPHLRADLVTIDSYPWKSEGFERAGKDNPSLDGACLVTDARGKKAIATCEPELKQSLIVFPGSWAAKTGTHHTGVDYLSFAPQYTRVNIRAFRRIAKEAGLDAVAVLYDMVPEEEQQLVSHKLRHDPKFCHPHLHRLSDSIFTPLYSERGRVLEDVEIVSKFQGLVLAGYSYGGASITQALNHTQRRMQDAGIKQPVIREALGGVLAVLIGPNADIIASPVLPVNQIIIASPLDHVMTGDAVPGGTNIAGPYLLSRIPKALRELAYEGIRGKTVSGALTGGWRDFVSANNPVQLDAAGRSFVFFARGLPGSVGFDQDGKRQEPFSFSNYGHSLPNYLRAIGEQFPEIVEAIKAFSSTEGKALDLASLLLQQSKQR